MSRIIIVGSGASGVHFALTVLKKGYEVLMLDIGHRRPEAVNPQDCFNDLKSNLPDPVKYFLGDNYEAVIYPDQDAEYYGFPPTKNYVFRKLDSFAFHSNGFEPLFSFARGGLAEAWTAGVYPLNDNELADFPFSYSDLEPHYNEIAKRIGISGVADELTRFYPLHNNMSGPLDLDSHSKLLLLQYKKNKDYLNKKLLCFLGRSRVATLSEDKNGRQACNYSGRCMWGCPSESLYTPSITLRECEKFSNFQYIPNMCVSNFNFDSKKAVTSVIAEDINKKQSHEFSLDTLVLAAGTLSSSKIYMDSIHRNTGELIKLRGLMDNRQALIPFLNLKMVGKNYDPNTYQYHQLTMGMCMNNSKEYVHGQITTLKSALFHPVIQSIPCDLKTAVSFFRNMHAGLGILNLNFSDSRRDNNYVTLNINENSSQSVMSINYSPKSNEKTMLKHVIKRVKKALLSLGCVVIPNMTHIRPMGASVHYAGTIPMSKEKIPHTTSMYCQSHDFNNLYILDGTTFPFLPAKNLTLTLMANACRVADTAF